MRADGTAVTARGYRKTAVTARGYRDDEPVGIVVKPLPYYA